MLLYLTLIRPFKDFVSNLMHIYNESLLLFVFATLLILNSASVTADTEETCGVVILVFIFISLFFSWTVFLLKLVKDLFGKKKANPAVEGKANGDSKNKAGKKSARQSDPIKNHKSASNLKDSREIKFKEHKNAVGDSLPLGVKK